MRRASFRRTRGRSRCPGISELDERGVKGRGEGVFLPSRARGRPFWCSGSGVLGEETGERSEVGGDVKLELSWQLGD